MEDIESWAQQGCKTCAHWLSWRVGLNAGAAREKIRVARALANLPLVVISKSMSKGEISYSKVRAVTQVATPNNEDQLLTIALGGTACQVECVVRAWRKVDLQAEKDHANYQQGHASLTTRKLVRSSSKRSKRHRTFSAEMTGNGHWSIGRLKR